MRCQSWCSALLAVVLLAVGCGGTHPARDPFAYDASRPLAVRDRGVAMSSPSLVVHSLTYAGADGKRVAAFLVSARTDGTRRPAVLFLHGSGGNRWDLLFEAVQLAARGAVTMTITQPADTPTFRPLVVNARRALDLLVARRDVDPDALGLVGYSLGGQTAAILAGDEPRLKSVGIIGGRGDAAPRYWIARTHAKLFFQAGTHDEVVPHAQLLALIAAAPGRPRVRWYATGHRVGRGVFGEQIAWQAAQLHLR